MESGWLPKTWLRTRRYLKLSTSEVDLDSDVKHFPEESRRTSLFWRAAPWIINLMLLSLSGAFLLQAIRIRQQVLGPLLTREYETASRECGSKKPLELSGEFGVRSIWRGEPNAAVDAAWDSLDLTSAMTVSRDEIERVGKLRNSSVILDSGGYMASLGAFHQMHCLNVLRKYTYLDYYIVKEPEFFRTPTVRKHTDHCIEMLRQLLMCSADLHLITYDWVDGVDHPWPDFSTNQFCRNYEDVHAWGKAHVVKSNYSGGLIPKPKNAITRKLPPD
ncbi:hypothetical protein L228DRAFT_267314 [Xylona heveae TC161]|uniref:Tat pathway signal sequence n=1 Tax=Xylona heveae (strain CBS 132557 / TC161) TaxID=1328760 RepID=A0A165HCM0_XYLHT|nr:hypothetical protein L228DRAFT_267314 [Xylona heveae TC161]KZF23305.1 hypothetical protein L228DRAFT_267314 [Xylona heveae TC161]